MVPTSPHNTTLAGKVTRNERIEPRAQFPRHRHVGDALVFVIEGALSDECGTITAGNMGYRPQGCIHTLSTTHGRPRCASSLAARSRRRSAAMRRHRRSWRSTSCHGWREGRACGRRKLIWEDAAGERVAFLARFEPGTTLPRHRHMGDELMFIIDGAAADESGVVATGNMNYRPNGCVHTVTTQQGATVLAVVWGRMELV